MKSIRSIARNSLTSLTIFFQITAFPMLAYAEEALPSSVDAGSTPTNQVEPAPATPEVDPSKYVLNPETGNYENDTYIWDPTTYQTTPKSPTGYSYNPDTARWETGEWAYDPSSNTYQPNVPVSPPPSQPPALTETAPINDSQLKTTQNNELSPNLFNTSNNPDETITNEQAASSFFDGFYNTTISNHIYSEAKSGNAAVTQNTMAGSALTGDASAIANLLNILQTAFSPGGSGNMSTFIANIDGNVVGDIMIDPGVIPTNNLSVEDNVASDVAINVENNGSIYNDINLTAQSGDALVNSNTKAGNAISGYATAIANVVIMINSSIASGDSFFGILNINGNFNGDILMPPNALDYLLASSLPRTTVNLNDLNNSEISSNATNNTTIANNVNATAISGNATVSGNTAAGSALSGNADTEVTILNMTGSNIVGSNALLVFVNVLGEWVGLLVNAPTGSTAAGYGGGIENYSSITANNLNFNAINNNAITNNINVAAITGDAEVSNNTLAGDARTGNATAKVNLANIVNSNIALTNWFGVLFINVFGSWTGSFGVNTAAGTTAPINPSSPPPVVGFNPGTGGQGGAVQGSSTVGGRGGGSVLPAATLGGRGGGDVELAVARGTTPVLLASAQSDGEVLGASTVPLAETGTQFNWLIGLASLLLLVAAVIGQRVISALRARKSGN